MPVILKNGIIYKNKKQVGTYKETEKSVSVSLFYSDPILYKEGKTAIGEGATINGALKKALVFARKSYREKLMEAQRITTSANRMLKFFDSLE